MFLNNKTTTFLPHKINDYIVFINDFSSANATPEFEGRGGEELATEISGMLYRAYDCPACLDLQKLCVIPNQQCWVLYIDVLVSIYYVPYPQPC